MAWNRHARRSSVTLGILLGLPLVSGCAGSDAPLGRLTDERTIVPLTPRSDPNDPRNPTRLEDRTSLLADGFGDYEHLGMPFAEKLNPENGSEQGRLW